MLYSNVLITPMACYHNCYTCYVILQCVNNSNSMLSQLLHLLFPTSEWNNRQFSSNIVFLKVERPFKWQVSEMIKKENSLRRSAWEDSNIFSIDSTLKLHWKLGDGTQCHNYRWSKLKMLNLATVRLDQVQSEWVHWCKILSGGLDDLSCCRLKWQ